MRINPKTTIVGQPAKLIRDFLRQVKDHSWGAESASKRLGVSLPKARRVIRDLVSAGYVQQDDGLKGAQWFQTTLDGNRLALASAAHSLKRVTAERKLAEFMERVKKVNHNSYYLYRVEKVVLFGSMLNRQDRVGDIDIAIKLRPKRANSEEQMTAERVRIAEAIKSGRRFSNVIDEVFWPQHEVGLYLKSRSRAISLHTTDDPILKECESRTIYEYQPAESGS